MTINANKCLITFFFITNLVCSLIQEYYIIYMINNLLNFVLLNIILKHYTGNYMNIYSIFSFVNTFFYFEDKFLLFKILFSSYFFMFYYNTPKKNRLLNNLKYFILIFLFDYNRYDFYYHYHLVNIYILSFVTPFLSKIYSINQLMFILDNPYKNLYLFFLTIVTYNLENYHNYMMVANDFLFTYLYYIHRKNI